MNFGKVALLALASASIVFLASCKDDPKKKSAPTVVVKTAADKELKEAAKEADFPLLIQATPDKDVTIKKITIQVINGDSKLDVVELNTEKSKTLNATLAKIERKEIPENVKVGKIAIVVTDSEKATTAPTIEFNFNGTNPSTDEAKWSASKEGVINNAAGVKEGAFNLKAGVKVKLTEGNKADRYMMNTTASGKAFAAAWTSGKITSIDPNPEGNGCKFQKVTLDFDKVTVKEAEAAYKDAEAKMAVDGVAANDVYLAKLGDEFYIIKIQKVDKDNNSTRKESDKGCIEFTDRKSVV